MKKLFWLLIAFALTINSAVMAQGYEPSGSQDLRSAQTVSSLPATLLSSSATRINVTVTGIMTLEPAVSVPGKIHYITRNVDSASGLTIKANTGDKIGRSVTGASEYTLHGTISTVGLQSDGIDRWLFLYQSPYQVSYQDNVSVTANITTAIFGIDVEQFWGSYTGGSTQTITLLRASRNRGRRVTFIKTKAAGTGDMLLVPDTANGESIFIDGLTVSSFTLTEQFESLSITAVASGSTTGWYVEAHYRPTKRSTDLTFDTIGKNVRIKEDTNGRAGVATLVAGTVNVPNTSITATSRILLTGQNSSGTTGELTVSARSAGVGFDITSTSVLDTRTIFYELKEPAP